MPKPHDSLFKRTFTNVKYAAVELRALLPPALLAKLELETLRVCPGSFASTLRARTPVKPGRSGRLVRTGAEET